MTNEEDRVRDTGTPEIGRHFKVVPIFVRGPSGGMSARVVDDTAMDRLLFHERITAQEYSILDELLRRLRKANIGSIKSPSFEAPVQSDPSIIADKRAQLIRSIVKLFNAMDKHRDIGPVKRRAVVSLALDQGDWPSEGDEALKAVILALQNIMLRR